ncbi:BnaC03g60210D [Brassica napus]|uniref:BnaC03g60210D protein n=1 Tax=Brassica napus TaxID=3708 RepID=A0A078FCL2_BRANA|nr:BnaC03g60210D [Brassica napus]
MASPLLVNDCWAAALHRAYSALLTLSGSPGRVLTRQGIIDGVDEAYQASGDGIDRLKYAISFMEKYVKEMNIYRRPRGNDASSYEDFESFTLQLLATTPVMVTVECLPSFQSFDGQVATTTEPSEINSDDPEALVKPQKPKRLKKIVDELSNRLDEMTEIVKKLKKNSDLLEEENNNTPKEKVVDHECYFESEDADFKNRRTIFVLGFDCSFPRDEIKRTLIKHFSSCGEVSRVYIPFHCDTGSPMGFAFISMGNPDKALTLNGSYLDGMRLEVTMATKRSEYYGYTNHRGCQRCGIASAKRLAKRFYDRTRIRIPLGTSFFSFIFESLKENNSYICDYFYRLHSVPSDF